MKIGILTYHRAHNYGAVLQSYALKIYLEQIGHNVTVVDYCPNYFNYGLFVWYKWFSLNPVKFFRKIRFQVKTFALQKRRYNAFSWFIDKYITPEQVNLNTENTNFDCFVFGSDQIWRENGDKFDPIYWGDFKAAKNTKLVSYAASMGISSLTDVEKQKIRNWLQHFSNIWVRENSLKKLLSPLVDKKVDVVVDPTFLLSKDAWSSIAVSPKRKRPYVLVYQVIENSAAMAVAKVAAEELDADIVEIASKIDSRKVSHEVVYDASPNEFVGWVENAAMVITTSFHGTAFSVIYRKPFVSIKQNCPSDLRIETLLESCGLIDRFIDCNAWAWMPEYKDTPVPIFDSVDFSKKLLNSIFYNEDFHEF